MTTAAGAGAGGGGGGGGGGAWCSDCVVLVRRSRGRDVRRVLCAPRS